MHFSWSNVRRHRWRGSVLINAFDGSDELEVVTAVLASEGLFLWELRERFSYFTEVCSVIDRPLRG